MILVTGAAGLSGSIIVRNFAESQTKASALARNRFAGALARRLSHYRGCGRRHASP